MFSAQFSEYLLEFGVLGLKLLHQLWMSEASCLWIKLNLLPALTLPLNFAYSVFKIR